MKMPQKRRSPRRHRVKAHTRDSETGVKAHSRGSGKRSVKRIALRGIYTGSKTFYHVTNQEAAESIIKQQHVHSDKLNRFWGDGFWVGKTPWWEYGNVAVEITAKGRIMDLPKLPKSTREMLFTWAENDEFGKLYTWLRTRGIDIIYSPKDWCFVRQSADYSIKKKIMKKP